MIDSKRLNMKWEMVKLGKLVKISKGKKHTEVPLEQAKFRYINIEDLHGGNEKKYTNEDGIIVNDNDVILAWDGANAGKVGASLQGVIGSTLARLSPITKDIDSMFLFWFLDSKFNFIKSQRTGATIPHVNGTSLKDLDIPLPPIPTQKRIAEILDKAHALRRKDQALIKKYDELAQAIFIDMFGGYQNVIKLNKICTKITDGVHAKPIYKAEGIPFLSVKNATKKYLDFSEVKYISLQDHQGFIKRCHPQKNDILYTKVGATYGRAALVDTDREFSIFVSLALIKPSQKFVLPEYLHFVLNSDFVIKQADRRIRGAGVPDLHLIEIRDFDIPLPKMDEQIKFVNQIKNINTIKKITTIEHSENLFQSLLVQAFQGGLN